MSKVFFEDLGLPKPDIYLGVGSGSHAEQTARVMVEFEKVCRDERPDLVVVAKAWIPVAHVEAGLRSFDRHMPEEINRIVTDRLSEILLTHSPERIRRVGNIMIDSLVANLEQARASKVLDELSLGAGGSLRGSRS